MGPTSAPQELEVSLCSELYFLVGLKRKSVLVPMLAAHADMEGETRREALV